METTQLNRILANHKKWLNGAPGGVRADLSRANLSDADFTGADLTGANLNRANLNRADLTGANLSGADLSGANLYGADLSRANLSDATLTRANLYGADLTGANLTRADLTDATLTRADLFRADLSETVGISKQILDICYPLVCPEEGPFIGWKRARDNLIVKLGITVGAKRSSAYGRKCRCSEAIVLAIENIDGRPSSNVAVSIYDCNFVYKIGEVVTVSDFDDDRFVECGAGIHFFITRQEAVNYSY